MFEGLFCNSLQSKFIKQYCVESENGGLGDRWLQHRVQQFVLGYKT